MSQTATASPAPAPRRRSRSPRAGKPTPAWHQVFLSMLPKITRYAKIAFRNLDREARLEAVQNVVANSCAAVAGLAKRGKLDLCYPTVLARFGIKQTRDHRITGGSLNIKDVLSKYCQANKRVHVDRLDKFNEADNAWEEVVVEDKTAGPDEIARVRIDFASFLASLPVRLRRIARFLAKGETTTAASAKFSCSPGRISQIRSELKAAWARHVGDDPGPASANAA